MSFYVPWQTNLADLRTIAPGLWHRSQCLMEDLLHTGIFRREVGKYARRAFPGGPLYPGELARGMAEANALFVAAQRWFFEGEAISSYEKREPACLALLDLGQRLQEAVRFNRDDALAAIEPLRAWLSASTNPLRGASPMVEARIDRLLEPIGTYALSRDEDCPVRNSALRARPAMADRLHP